MKTFYWLMQREIWEHRAFWIAPTVVSALLLFFILLAITGLSAGPGILDIFDHVPALDTLDSDTRAAMTQLFAYGIYAGFDKVMLIVLAFYLQESLNNDRKDRSILFWKSLPITDTGTVLSKLATAMLSVPVMFLAFVIGLHLLLLILGSVVGIAGGLEGWYLAWHPGQLLLAWLALVNGLLVQSLFLLPFFAWFLLCSAFFRTAALVWAIMIPLVIGLFENWVLDTGYVMDWIGQHAGAAMNLIPSNEIQDAFQNNMSYGQTLPLLRGEPFWESFASSTFWTGAVVAAVLIIAAIWLRRYRDDS